MGGKIGAGGQTEWEGIRGAPNEVGRIRNKFNLPHATFSIDASIDPPNGEPAAYSVSVWFDSFGPHGYRVTNESLVAGSKTIFTTLEAGEPLGDMLWLEFGEDAIWQFPYSVSKFQPALGQFFVRFEPLHGANVTDPGMIPIFQHMRFLDPVPTRMREPSIPGATILGDAGQNLPTVIESICADADRKQTLLSWFEELTPSGRVHLQIVERNGRKISANSASDGTLRFLAMLVLLLNEDDGGTYFFEEIDTGIHPNRLWLLLDLIERQTAKGKIQVITTTHNPALLDWIRDDTFEHTSVIYRDEYWSDSVIRPIADLYHLRELRKSRGLGRLFTSGWLERAMKASEGDFDTDHLDDDDEDDWGMDDE